MQNVNFILKIVDNCRDILYNQIHEQKKLCKRYSLYRDIRGFDGDIHVVCVDSFFPCAFDLSNGDMRYGGIAFGGEKGGLVHVYICIHGASAGNTCVFGRKRRAGHGGIAHIRVHNSVYSHGGRGRGGAGKTADRVLKAIYRGGNGGVFRVLRDRHSLLFDNMALLYGQYRHLASGFDF